jgi:hypothetical protein
MKVVAAIIAIIMTLVFAICIAAVMSVVFMTVRKIGQKMLKQHEIHQGGVTP